MSPDSKVVRFIIDLHMNFSPAQAHIILIIFLRGDLFWQSLYQQLHVSMCIGLFLAVAIVKLFKPCNQPWF